MREFFSPQPFMLADFGSSLRMRGICLQFELRALRRRFIPAHAGNSLAVTGSCSRSTVHPRACGEFTNPSTTPTRTRGSSPRMRGIRRWAVRGAGTARLIPAHAGNSSATARSRCRPPVHPRACGEFDPAAAETSPARGSSPRMRGIPDVFVRAQFDARFIPAHAGNSQTCCSRKSAAAVHPRACGEFCVARCFSRYSSGSSPRMRGIPAVHPPSPSGGRFIPAHAGNSPKNRFRRLITPVHPRACGEF